MDQSPDVSPLLVAAPRHLRRRRLHREIPDTLLVPDAGPLPLEPERTAPGRTVPGKRAAADNPLKPKGTGTTWDRRAARASARVSLERKRTVALILVILVSFSIPALVLALMFAG